MTLLLVRHCQTDWNREPARCQGWAEVELNETGRAHARDLGRAFAGRGIELVVSSHLVRAVQSVPRGGVGQGDSAERAPEQAGHAPTSKEIVGVKAVV